MANEEVTAIGSYLWRGGQKLNIKKDPDRFTVRLERGVSPEEVETTYHADHRRTLARQRLEEFAVEATARDATMARLRQGDEAEFVSHVYSFEADPTSRFYLTDEITVQFKPDVEDDEIEQLTAQYGLELVKEVAGAPHTYVFRVTSQATENPIKIANRLQDSDRVLVSEPDIAVPQQSLYIPTDPLFPQQWHLHHTGGLFLAADSHVDAVKAWDITRGERSVVVAVADDSVDLLHVDFQGPGKIVAPVDFQGRDFDPSPEHEDDNHGTACAGVAVAEENGIGVVGIAPGCALMPIRTSGFIDDTSIEELCQWVIEHGASVLSCSWSAAAVFFSLSLRMRVALQRAATEGQGGRGCVIVFAAGNSNRPVNGVVNEQGWPDNLLSGPTHWLNGFATHPDVIAVAASTSLARKSAYSNWGNEISVCAPSNNAPPRTFPRVTTPLPGRGIVTTDRVGPSGYSSTDYTFAFGGTSSACPLVAGVAALVLSANPDLSAKEVKEILEETADKITDTAPDPQLGLSLGTYDQNGRSAWFGAGKVNAFRAVTEAVKRGAAAVTQTFQRTSTPALVIPDFNLPGVQDTITFSEAARLKSIKVHIDLSHTFIADLRLTLRTPSGRAVVLHNRSGGNAHDIKRTFDASSTPALSTLMDESIQGDWTLHIQDLAPADIGQLNSWGLEIEGQVDAVVELEESPGVTIPDNNPMGIERVLSTTESGQIKKVEVSVDITHTYIGDLIITLFSPAGTSVTLHNRAGGDADNIITTYTPATTPELQVLSGKALQGTWKLRVADVAAVDVGKLNRWALRIFREP